MPFTDSENYKNSEVFSLLEECLMKNNELEIRPIKLIRADSIFNTQNILSRLWNLINREGILIADLTTRNPNVMYEVGLCHSIGRDVILLSNNEEDVPIDLRVGTTYFYYKNLKELVKKIPFYINQYIKVNSSVLFSIEEMVNKIKNDRFLKELFFELCEFSGRYISQQIDDSRLKDKYTKKKFAICLSGFYFINKGLFEIENFDEYGAGVIKITEYGLKVKSTIENS
jgi:hypothetical protein